MQEFLALVSPLQKLSINWRLTDIFDVTIVTVIIYGGLLLFKRTRSFSILVGIASVLLTYVFSQVFSLYLTTLFLQSFFSVFLVLIVVIFQEELRRFFEFIAVFGTRQIRKAEFSETETVVNEITQAVSNMAHRQIGALIVLQGNENIERHIEGGHVLDGVLSQELLESIFDPTSPGHDGAVIIHGKRAAMLGAHLPLSRNFEQIGKHGTRHSAAVGIAERSDALAVIVSEESGGISIARAGKLTTLDGTEALEKVLMDFFKEKFPAQAVSFWTNIIRKNTPEKLLAFCMASLLWFFLVFQAGTVRRDYKVPLSFLNLGEELVVEDIKPSIVTVTLESRGKASDILDPKDLEIAIDGTDLKVGAQRLALTENLVKRPSGFEVVNINPPDIQLQVGKYYKSELPVNARISGQPASGYVVSNVSVSPGSVQTLIAELSRKPEVVVTEPIDINNINETISVPATLVLPRNVRLQDPSDVTVSVRIEVRKR